MKVLVTGGAGFIGSHTVDELLKAGYEVRILDSLQRRVHPRGKPKYLSNDAELHIGDVSNRADLGLALEGVDYVIHLAAYQDYLPDFSTFFHVNAESAALIFELIVASRHPVQKVVFASSQAVAGEGRYRCVEHGIVVPEARSIQQLEEGDWEIHCPVCSKGMQPLLIDERTSRPHTAYGISKYATELLAGSLGRRYGIKTACMRYTYVQGARNSFFNAYSGICRIFALRILNGLSPICYEDGNQRRDYINVSDVARANVRALESTVDDHGIYNVGGGRPITVLEFAQIMLNTLDSRLEPSVPGMFRVGDTRHTVSDISAMRNLGWDPTIPVEQSVKEYTAWMSLDRDTKAYLDEAELVLRKQEVIRPVASKA